jgi:polar amino acid transport system substrate-binding protein
VRLAPLITHRFAIADGERAYNLIAGETREPYLGVVLNYDTERELAHGIERRESDTSAGQHGASAGAPAAVRVGMIGAGSYAQKFLLPNFKAEGAAFHAIATASGISARGIGEKYDFARVAASAEEVFADAAANLVVIATRHDSHAGLARRALEEGRHVFVEKPLALNDEELDGVLRAARASRGQLLVGYNRRFSPHARACAEAFAARREPLSIAYRVNAGRIARTSWIQDSREGGGRIIGEVCHFIDLMHFLTGAVTTRVYAESITSRNEEIVDEDSIFVTLRFSDGSNGQIAYLAEGDRALAKERVEVFGGGKTFVIEDFRSATLYERGRERRQAKLRAQDKGQAAEVRALCAMVREGAPAPIALADLAATTRATFRIRDSLRTGQAMEVTGEEINRES